MHDALDVFEHDNGVVDNDADGQHHAEQRQRVDRIAEQQQAGKSTDQRYRDCGERNQRGAPVLQEQEYHQEHQRHRLEQRVHHLTDRNLHKTRGVVHHVVGEARRIGFKQRRHCRLDAVCGGQRIGVRLQENANESRCFAINATDEVVILGTQFDARHVFQPQQRSVGVGADDDVLEFRGLRQPSLGGDGIDQFLRPAGRRLADLAGGELRVLFVQRACQVTRRQFQLRQAVRTRPDAHRVVLGAENLHVGGAGDAFQRVEYVQCDVV